MKTVECATYIFTALAISFYLKTGITWQVPLPVILFGANFALLILVSGFIQREKSVSSDSDEGFFEGEKEIRLAVNLYQGTAQEKENAKKQLSLSGKELCLARIFAVNTIIAVCGMFIQLHYF